MTKLSKAGASPADSIDSNADTSARQDGYLRIGDIAKIHDVTLRTLRFYEDKGLLRPKREGSTRLYDRRDVVRLKLILKGRRVGFSLREVKHMMDLYDPKGSNTKQLRVTLEKSEKQYARLQKQRALLDEAMGELSGMIDGVRDQLQGKRSAA